MTDKEKIIAEIERLERETDYEPFTDEVLGKRTACNHLKSFIESMSDDEDFDKLQEGDWNKISDVNKAAEAYYDVMWDELGGIGTCLIENEYDIWYPSSVIETVFKAGADWKEQKLMQDAVDGVVYNNPTWPGNVVGNLPFYSQFKQHESVKLIIIRKKEL